VESRGEGRARGLKTRHVLVVPRCAIPRTFLEAAALAVLTPVCPLRSRSGKSERTFNGLSRGVTGVSTLILSWAERGTSMKRDVATSRSFARQPRRKRSGEPTIPVAFAAIDLVSGGHRLSVRVNCDRGVGGPFRRDVAA